MALEELFNDLGGFGKFQVYVVLCVYPMKGLLGWSMMHMAFGGLIPDYNCVTNTGSNQSETTVGHHSNWVNQSEYANNSLNVCSVNGIKCKEYNFHGSARTVITEWDLICDLKWIKATLTSVQMGGVLAGAAFAGQCGDYFGRKKTLYAALLGHAVACVIAGFSVSWLMFAVMRFFIGMFIGAVLVISVPYMTEFMPIKWRMIVPVLPFWSVCVSLFAGAAYVIKDWAHLHFATAVVTVPGLLGFFYMPESVRWLTVQGRRKEAYAVIEQMARMNGRPVPSYARQTIEEIAKEEEESRSESHKYTYVDIFRGKTLIKTTLIFGFHWATFSTVYYGISFSASSFSINVYLNIFTMNMLDIPIYVITFWIANGIGRRWSSVLFLAIGTIAALACLLVRIEVTEGYKEILINVFSLTSRMASRGAWVTSQIWVVEVYPTVTRSLGYGFANTAARVGGIVAPFAVNLDDIFVFSYIYMCSIYFISLLLVLLVKETKGAYLGDSMKAFHIEISVKVDNEDHKEMSEKKISPLADGSKMSGLK